MIEALLAFIDKHIIIFAGLSLLTLVAFFFLISNSEETIIGRYFRLRNSRKDNNGEGSDAASPKNATKASVSSMDPAHQNANAILQSIDFSRALNSISIIRWSDHERTTKFITHLGNKFEIPLQDESINVFSRELEGEYKGRWEITADSQGVIEYESLIPDKIEPDADRYKRNGSHFSALVPLDGLKTITGIVRRYNGFMPGQEDFIIKQTQCRIAEMVIHINFAAVMGECAFKRLPQAYCCNSGSKKALPGMTSHYGSSWKAKYKTQSPDDALKVEWGLCNGRPEGPIYIFGYGSLMHEQSLMRTIPDYFATSREAAPAVLHGYKKCWSAVSPNIYGDMDRHEEAPPYVSYMNIKEEEGAEAHGVLVHTALSELDDLDIREGSYVRLEVTDKIKPLNGVELPTHATVFAYITFPPEIDDKDAIGVVQDYIDLIENASQRIDKNLEDVVFSQDFRESCEELRDMRRLTKGQPDYLDRYKF